MCIIDDLWEHRMGLCVCVCVCVCVLCLCREWFGAAFKIDTQKAGAEGIDQRDIIQ